MRIKGPCIVKSVRNRAPSVWPLNVSWSVCLVTPPAGIWSEAGLIPNTCVSGVDWTSLNTLWVLKEQLQATVYWRGEEGWDWRVGLELTGKHPLYDQQEPINSPIWCSPCLVPSVQSVRGRVLSHSALSSLTVYRNNDSIFINGCLS